MDKLTKAEVEEIINDVAYRINQSSKKENSGLVSDMKGMHEEVTTRLTSVDNRLFSIDSRFATLNGSVAKQADKLSAHDIINAQVTLSQQQFFDTLKSIEKEGKDNTEFRLRADGSLSTFKWLFGLLGIGNIILLIKAFFPHLP